MTCEKRYADGTEVTLDEYLGFRTWERGSVGPFVDGSVTCDVCGRKFRDGDEVFTRLPEGTVYAVRVCSPACADGYDERPFMGD